MRSTCRWSELDAGDLDPVHAGRAAVVRGLCPEVHAEGSDSEPEPLSRAYADALGEARDRRPGSVAASSAGRGRSHRFTYRVVIRSRASTNDLPRGHSKRPLQAHQALHHVLEFDLLSCSRDRCSSMVFRSRCTLVQ